MFTNLKKYFFVPVFLAFFLPLFSESTPVEGLYRYKLDNGLELFVAENDSAPLAYIEIAVRAGAVTQNPQNAGLFHLYEHMMFKGNEMYADQDAFTEAANEMGQIDQNGSTGIDRVNYYFTIPSALVRRGLEFWSYAIRTPKIDNQELENEKSVVLSEINADFTDPDHIRAAAIYKTMFPDCPWRLDPSGNPVVIQNASPELLREIQKNYYIPSNSAIFVGGDVKHDEVFAYVKEIYSDWENPSEALPFARTVNKNPLSSEKKLIFVNPGLSDRIIQVSYYLRGPDGEIDIKDTYSADVWVSLANSPSGNFVKTFVSDSSLGIPESEYIGAYYPTRRVSGLISFSAAMVNDYKSSEKFNFGFGNAPVAKQTNLNPVEKSERFLSVLKEKAIPEMTKKSLFFKDKSIGFVIQQLEDARIYEMESAESLLASLSFFWSTCSSDYFFSYDENIAKVTEDDVVSFVKKYMQNKKGAFIVSVSPGLWNEYKDLFLASGYEQISAENAFWQNDIK